MNTSSYSRKDRLIQEKRHDAYAERDKWPEPTLCKICGALYVNGRWSWQEPPAESYKVICPACRRIADRYPAGYVELKGEFLISHRDEILNLVQNVEKREKSEHPLERIMMLTDEAGVTLVTTSGVHLARRIGEALARAYKGELSCQYADADDVIRVSWQR